MHEHRNVWSLSPTFRAEKSDTSRHLSEFWMLEAEIQTETLRDVMDLVENMIRTLTLNLQKSKLMDDIISSKCMGETETATSLKSMHDLIRGRWKGLLRKSWARITYGEVIQRLQHAVDSKQVEFEHQPSWATGLQLEHEKFVAAEFGQGSPVFVTEYPQEIKAFYMLPSELKDESEPSATAACFDLLVPDICEIVGGSLREHRLGYLIDAMHKHGLVRTSVTRSIKDDGKNGQPLIDAGNLDWYLDLRRFGSVPHGGFGLGLDRLVGYLAGVHNIKDVIAWPRWHGRCDC